MEAKELMIGDLIDVFGQNGDISASPHWYYRKVTSDWLVDMERRESTNKTLSEHGLSVSFPQIGDTAPIPLTEDILKANGWQKNDPHWVSTLRRYCDKYGSGWSLSFTLQKGIWDAYIHNGGELNINKFHPMYVHELQHALRLCGLNELADNFKV